MSPPRQAPKREPIHVPVTTDSAREAIKSAVLMAGGPSVVARHFGYKNPQSVIYWYDGKYPNRGIDPIIVRQLAKLCKHRIGIVEMLPEVFGGLTKRELGAPLPK